MIRIRSRYQTVATVAAWAFIGTCNDARSAEPTSNEKPAAAAPLSFPNIPPLEPKDALKSFSVRDGFRMELIAAEPLVADPVAAEFDEESRLFVVEMRGYPYPEEQGKIPIGRVRILEDLNDDGIFDKSSIFVDELSWPTCLAFWKGGVFVGAAPDIWYFKDTDGDRKADIREQVYTGFSRYNVQAIMNNLKWGVDHRIYGAASGNGGSVTRVDRPNEAPVVVKGADFRFDPVSRKFEATSGGARFGNAFDDWYNRFICNIRNPLQHVVLPNEYLARNRSLPIASATRDAAESGDTMPVYPTSKPEPWRELRAQRWRAIGKAIPKSELVGAGYFTSAAGATVYRGSAYPEAYRGDVFIAEVANNVIHRQKLTPEGVSFTSRRADPNTEFVQCTDNWFRPVNFVNAPDGTLLILDMYRETIEHPWSIPDDIRAQLDLNNGHDRGRIYRLAPPGFKYPGRPKLPATTTDLVAWLDHPNSWLRETAHRLLWERQDKSAQPQLERLAKEGKTPQGRMHAIWSLHGMQLLTEPILLTALGDPSPRVREYSVRLSEPLLPTSSAVSTRLLTLAEDDDARVRMQVAFSLGAAPMEARLAGMEMIARRDPGDQWTRAAVLSSMSEGADRLIERLASDSSLTRSAGGAALIASLAEVVGVQKHPAEVGRVLAVVARLSGSDAIGARTALVGLNNGLVRARSRLTKHLKTAPPEVAGSIRGIIQAAAPTASDASVTPETREAAIRILGCGDFADVRATLAGLLDAKQPQTLQSAAIRALAKYSEPEVADILLPAWPSCTPPVRTEMIDVLLSRTPWIGPLLAAVGSGQVPSGQIPPARKELLMKSADMKVRELAIKLFGPDAPSPRKDVIAAYQKCLQLTGDSGKGRKVFERECMTCHRIGEQGYEVGPNLSSIRHRTPDGVMIHVLDPNREIAPSHIEYLVSLDDGRVVTGLIAAETATSITLKRAQGAQDTILRQNIESIASTGKSLMPEGMEKKIPPEEMADLLAYLLGLQTQ